MLPIIDLQDFPAQSEPLLDACVAWGCFRIVNHRIPATLVAEMKSAATAMLDLPPATKRRNTDVVAEGVGYIGPTEVNPLYEGLGFYDVADEVAVDEFCDQLDASPEQRKTIAKYCKVVHELAMEIGKRIAESLGLHGDLLEGYASQFRINKYNFTPEKLGSTGVRIHSDLGFLTILQEDDIVGGLEIMDKVSGEFVAVDPLPGSLLVNVGDIATVWSNGKFYNMKHRVVCKEPATRVSIVLFVLGPKEGVVEPPPQLVGPDNPRLYGPIAFEDYRKLRLSTNLKAGEALSLFRTKTSSS